MRRSFLRVPAVRVDAPARYSVNSIRTRITRVNQQDDVYWKLRPPPPTPAEELCSCTGNPPIMLQPHLSANPVSCFDCNLEVPPERLGISAALAERVAFWRDFHDCLYRLWLDSGPFESWAKAQLENPASPVHERGLELAKELGQVRRTYYWWFQDTGAEGFQPFAECPRCQATLVDADGRLICESCLIVVAN